VTPVGLAKGVLAVAGILLFLWARDDDQQTLRWIAIGLMIAAWMLRFVEKGRRQRGDEGDANGKVESEGEGKG
jgi:hypothetical protein